MFYNLKRIQQVAQALTKLCKKGYDRDLAEHLKNLAANELKNLDWAEEADLNCWKKFYANDLLSVIDTIDTEKPEQIYYFARCLDALSSARAKSHVATRKYEKLLSRNISAGYCKQDLAISEERLTPYELNKMIEVWSAKPEMKKIAILTMRKIHEWYYNDKASLNTFLGLLSNRICKKELAKIILRTLLFAKDEFPNYAALLQKYRSTFGQTVDLSFLSLNDKWSSEPLLGYCKAQQKARRYSRNLRDEISQEKK